MAVDDLPLHPGAVVGYGINRLGYAPRPEEIEALRQEILGWGETQHPPSDDELTVMLHGENLECWNTDFEFAWFWQLPEDKRALHFRDFEKVLEELMLAERLPGMVTMAPEVQDHECDLDGSSPY